MDDGQTDEDVTRRRNPYWPQESSAVTWPAVVVIVAVLTTTLILVIDPDVGRAVRADIIGWFLTGALVVLLLVLASALFVLIMTGVFAGLGLLAQSLSNNWMKAKVFISAERSTIVPTFLSTITGVTVPHASDAIASFSPGGSALFLVVLTGCTLLGAVLGDRDVPGAKPSKIVGSILLVAPCLVLLGAFICLWWQHFLDASEGEQFLFVAAAIPVLIGACLGLALIWKRPAP